MGHDDDGNNFGDDNENDDGRGDDEYDDNDDVDDDNEDVKVELEGTQIFQDFKLIRILASQAHATNPSLSRLF